MRYLIVAACGVGVGADEGMREPAVEEEGGAALREKPMFSNVRGEGTDQ